MDSAQLKTTVALEDKLPLPPPQEPLALPPTWKPQVRAGPRRQLPCRGRRGLHWCAGACWGRLGAWPELSRRPHPCPCRTHPLRRSSRSSSSPSTTTSRRRRCPTMTPRPARRRRPRRHAASQAAGATPQCALCRISPPAAPFHVLVIHYFCMASVGQPVSALNTRVFCTDVLGARVVAMCLDKRCVCVTMWACPTVDKGSGADLCSGKRGGRGARLPGCAQAICCLDGRSAMLKYQASQSWLCDARESRLMPVSLRAPISICAAVLTSRWPPSARYTCAPLWRLDLLQPLLRTKQAAAAAPGSLVVPTARPAGAPLR
jgi:hypothetical protein